MFGRAGEKPPEGWATALWPHVTPSGRRWSPLVDELTGGGGLVGW